METFMKRAVERALFFACCLIIAPVTSAPTTDLERNAGNSILDSRFHIPDEDSSNEDTWMYDHPQYFTPLLETKRRSSFFPVRGKKMNHNVIGMPTGHSVASPELTVSDGRITFPVMGIPPHYFHGASHDDRDGVQNSPNGQQQAVENAPDEVLDMARPLNGQQPQKRRSSFMPMRGRKRYLSEDNMEFLKRYLSSKMRVSPLGITSDEMGLPNFDENGFKFNDDLRPVSIEETGNGYKSENPQSFSGGRIFSAKRALSFVPTRGRREVSEFPSHVDASRPSAKRPEDSPAGQVAANLSGKSHPRYRRGSAFLPMRGRKSFESPYWLAYHYLPQDVDAIPRFRDYGRPNNVENIGQQQSSEVNKMQGLSFGEDMNYIGGQRLKKSSDEDVQQQKLRTALVMKRPLSFFAARGKRLDDDGIGNH